MISLNQPGLRCAAFRRVNCYALFNSLGAAAYRFFVWHAVNMLASRAMLVAAFCRMLYDPCPPHVATFHSEFGWIFLYKNDLSVALRSVRIMAFATVSCDTIKHAVNAMNGMQVRCTSIHRLLFDTVFGSMNPRRSKLYEACLASA